MLNKTNSYFKMAEEEEEEEEEDADDSCFSSLSRSTLFP